MTSSTNVHYLCTHLQYLTCKLLRGFIYFSNRVFTLDSVDGTIWKYCTRCFSHKYSNKAIVSSRTFLPVHFQRSLLNFNDLHHDFLSIYLEVEIFQYGLSYASYTIKNSCIVNMYKYVECKPRNEFNSFYRCGLLSFLEHVLGIWKYWTRSCFCYMRSTFLHANERLVSSVYHIYLFKLAVLLSHFAQLSLHQDFPNSFPEQENLNIMWPVVSSRKEATHTTISNQLLKSKIYLV